MSNSNFIYYGNELYHYGVPGQKWGKRNYQYEDGSYTQEGQSQNWGHGRYAQISNETNQHNKKNGSRSDVINRKVASRANTNSKKILGLSNSEYEKAKKMAKIIGVSLATTAGCYLVIYSMNNGGLSLTINSALQRVGAGYNSSLSGRTYSIEDVTGLGSALRSRLAMTSNDSYIGRIASSNGYTDKYSIESMIAKNIDREHLKPMELIKNVRINQIGIDSTRRLSCWSASNAYFMTNATGNDFCSKSFANLVDFNDFKKLFKNDINIFDINGSAKKDFVGKFGNFKKRVSSDDAETLVRNLFESFKDSKSNYYDDSVDKVTGFINAGYHGTTCTHEFNFEIIRDKESKVNELMICDGWSGERYFVAKQSSDNTIEKATGFIKLMDELNHYNANSLRYYAPNLEDFNLETLKNVILMKKQ